jgi:hypothetical protein
VKEGFADHDRRRCPPPAIQGARATLTRLFCAIALLSLPLTAAAQRVEVALLAGDFLPVPRVHQDGVGFECYDDPCPPSNWRRVVRSSGFAIGGRLTVQLGPRYGVDASIQTTRITHDLSGSAPPTGIDNLRLTLFTLQPHVRLALGPSLEADLGAGLVVSMSESETGVSESAWRNGFTFSGAVRARLARLLSLELRGSLQNYALDSSDQGRTDMIWGAGLVYAFGRFE